MSSGLLDSSWDMDAGVLNLHDEHFGYCNESNDLMGESSVFSSFVQELNHGDGVESTWILPETDAESESGAVETKEDFKKTLEDWQQHVSNLQSRDDIKDPLLYDASEDMPDIFGTAFAFPAEKVPKKKKVQKYVIAKRNGLVLKLKKEDDDDTNCDDNKPTNKHRKNKVVIKEEQPRVQIKEEKLEEFNLLNPSEFLGSVIVGSVPEVKQEVLDIKEEILDYNESLDLKHLEFESIPELESSYVSTILSEFESNVAVPEYQDNPIELFEEKKPPKIFAQPKHDNATKLFTQPKKVVQSVKKSPTNVTSEKKQKVQIKTKTKSEIKGPKQKSKASNKLSKKQTESKVLPDLTSARAELKAPVKTVQKQESKSPTNAITKPELKVLHKTTPQPEAKTVPLPKNTELKTPLKLTKIKEMPVKATTRELPAEKSEQKDLFLEELIKNERPAKFTKKYKTLTSTKRVEPNNKSIMESLPKEVIDRIKESSKRNKKSKVSLVPAERLPVRANDHMKDKGVTSHVQVSGVTSDGNLVKLDHNYCTGQQQQEQPAQQQLTPKPQHQQQSVQREEMNRSGEEWGGDSKKDSGLESGEVSDASETHYKGRANCKSVTPPHSSSEPNQPQSAQMIDRKEEASTESSDTAVATQEPKKKKLNLEEYRKLRKIAKPRSSPIKARPIGWHLIPINQESINKKRKAEMVNAEVQVQLGSETKENDPQGDTNADKKEEDKGPERYRLRSSSSSSCESKSRYRSRGRSKRRHHSRSRSQRSHWSYSRSRSRSRSSSCSYSSSSSRSRSRSSRGSSRRKHHSRNSYRSNRSSSYRKSSPKKAARRSDDWSPVEKMRQVEERRVIYVGRLEEGTTKAQLRERFTSFGKIVDISLHFREKGDNYGFVTFAYKVDAYEAVEHGNDYPLQPKYDICFGGRRAFCKQRYSDLDGTSPQSYSPHQQNSRSNDSFDNLLREAQKKLKRSSHV